jgi:hypothetical protein
MMLRAGDAVHDGIKKFDDLDRRRLAPIGAFGWLGVLVQAGVPHRQVPSEFWTVSHETSSSLAKVDCPCGHRPDIELAAFPVKCECERRFFFAGREVWCFGTQPN